MESQVNQCWKVKKYADMAFLKCVFLGRINDHENCASLLIGAIDASIVNCEDDKGR